MKLNSRTAARVRRASEIATYTAIVAVTIAAVAGTCATIVWWVR